MTSTLRTGLVAAILGMCAGACGSPADVPVGGEVEIDPGSIIEAETVQTDDRGDSARIMPRPPVRPSVAVAKGPTGDIPADTAGIGIEVAPLGPLAPLSRAPVPLPTPPAPVSPAGASSGPTAPVQ